MTYSGDLKTNKKALVSIRRIQGNLETNKKALRAVRHIQDNLGKGVARFCYLLNCDVF